MLLKRNEKKKKKLSRDKDEKKKGLIKFDMRIDVLDKNGRTKIAKGAKH